MRRATSPGGRGPAGTPTVGAHAAAAVALGAILLASAFLGVFAGEATSGLSRSYVGGAAPSEGSGVAALEPAPLGPSSQVSPSASTSPAGLPASTGAYGSGTGCPSAQVVASGTVNDSVAVAGATDYWAASYPTAEPGEWLTGYELTTGLAFDNAGLAPGTGTALIQLELTTSAYTPWGGGGTSLLGPPAGGVAVASYSLYVGGGNDAVQRAGSESCLALTVPSTTPYLTLVVSASSSVLPGLVASAAVAVDLVAPGGAVPCLTGTSLQSGGQADVSAASGSGSTWASSDPSPVLGEVVTGFQASLSGAYSGGTAPVSASYGSVEAYLLLSSKAYAAWNGPGQPLTSFPAGANVVGVFELPVATTGGSGNLGVSVSCLDLVVPSATPYLSIVLEVNTTVSPRLAGELQSTTYLVASGTRASGCDAGGNPQYGGESDAIASGGGGGGMWAASDPASLSGDYINNFEASLVQSYAGSPAGGPLFGSSLFVLFLSPVAYTSWNSGGQAISALPPGSLVLGTWTLATGSEGDHGGAVVSVNCLAMVVPNGTPYLSLLVNSSGPVGLTSEVQSVTYGTVTTHTAACSLERNATAQLGQEDSVATASTTSWWAASAAGNFGGERIDGLTLSTSTAPNPGTSGLPDGAYVLVWLLSTATLYAGNNGPGTSLTGFPAGTVLASVKLATGSGYGSMDQGVALTCLDAIVPSSEPYLTTMLELVSGPGGNLDAEVQAMVRAAPAGTSTPCVSPGAMAANTMQAGGQADTLATAGIGWWVSSDTTNLSGEVVTSVSFSASLTFGGASARATFGEALFSVFFTKTPYLPWNSAGQAVGSFPLETAPVGQWILKTGSANESAAESTQESCLALPVPVSAPYLSVMVDPLASSTAQLQAEVQLAIGTATPAPLGEVVRAMPTLGDAGRTNFFFTAAPTGGLPPYSQLWATGDGGLYPGNAVNHTYAAPGSYTVDVWTNDSIGGSVLRTLVLPVSAPLTATVSVSPGGPWDVGEALSFSASEIGGAPPILFTWKFGDGGASIFQNASHTYLAPGNETVHFWANDSAGASVNASVPMVLSPQPAASPYLQPGVAEVGTPVTFYANASGGAGPVEWTWRFGDGTSASTENASHTYGAAGAYSASLFMNDSAGTKVARALSVQVDPSLHTSISFSANHTRVGSSPGVVVSASPSGGTGTYRFAWWLNGSAWPSTSPSLRFAPTGAGNYSFLVVATDSAGYSASASGTLAVLPPLRVWVVATPTNLTQGQSVKIQAFVYGAQGPVSYTWSYLPTPCVGSNVSTLDCVPGSSGHFAVGVSVRDALGSVASGVVGFTVVSPSSGTPPLLGGSLGLELVLSGAAVLVGVVVALVVVFVVRRRRRGVAARSPEEASSSGSDGEGAGPASTAFVPVPLGERRADGALGGSRPPPESAGPGPSHSARALEKPKG